ncbi:MAG: SDR family oxidoreductase [Wenzhouxiangella sp.]|nr:MAG: SDR family oxidoreductase [Wenzhouxiangella sp.]
MKVLVTGAGGFIGSAIVECLLEQGHAVVACVRERNNLPPSPRLNTDLVDLSTRLDANDWMEVLDGVDAVVNAAGILRENRPGDFDRIHHQAPLALAEACVRRKIRRFVQISALGHPDDGAFVASKHRLDADLLAMPGLEAIVLRPSVVVSLRGAYGGTSMLRAMAALPLVLFLPGPGQQKIQPLLLEDLCGLVLQGLQDPHGRSAVVDAVGPEVLTLKDYLLATRRWLKLPEPSLIVSVPMGLVRLAGRLGDLLRAGPLGQTMTRMLERGNVSPGSPADQTDSGATEMRSVSASLAQSASFVQDRWHARLYWLGPMAWLALVVIWLVSALSGLVADAVEFGPVLDRMGVPLAWQPVLVLSTAALNLALGIALLLRIWLARVLALMWICVLAYSLGLGLLVPELWLEPIGGLVKNLALLVLIPVVMVLENRR